MRRTLLLLTSFFFVQAAAFGATSSQRITAQSPLSLSNGTLSLTLTDTTITSKLLTGFTSGAGTITASDSILSAIQKLDGNIEALGGGGGSSVPDGINSGDILAWDSGTSAYVSIPVGSGGQYLTPDDFQTGGLVWQTPANGDVNGPGSSTDEALVVMDGTTGKAIKEASPKLATGDHTLHGTGKSLKVVNDNNSNAGFEVGKAYWTYGTGSRVATFMRGDANPDYDYVETSVDSNDISGFKRRKNFFMGDVNWDYNQALLNNNGFRYSLATVSGEHRFDLMLRGSAHARVGQLDFVYNNNGGVDVVLYSLGTEGTFFARQTGKGLSLKQGSGALAGNATLVGGTVTVTNANITSDSIIILQRKSPGGTVGDLTYDLDAGTGFTINSASGSDTSTVSYVIQQTHS